MTAPAQMDPHKRIALLLDLTLDCCRNLTRGIHTYASERQEWILRTSPCDPEVVPSLRDWKPDGIIATVFDPKMAEALAQLNRPVVDTAFAIHDLELPVVDVDHVVVGQLAAEHLLERGHTHFGFLGSKSAPYSEARERSYTESLAEDDYSVSKFHVEYLYEDLATSSWKRDEQQIQHWVERLPKPVGIFACHDIAGRGLIDVCQQAQLRVPEEIAILGADDDDLHSLLTSPPLSSVAVPAKQVGYEAAAMLDRIMSGKPTEKSHFVLPVRVITRQSTDTRATDDIVTSVALRYIRVHAAQDIGVSTVAEAVGVGRRELERKFRQLLNCTVLEEIHRARTQRVKELLAATDLPMSTIALRAGFLSAQRMAVVFNQIAGMSPTSYRQQISVYG